MGSPYKNIIKHTNSKPGEWCVEVGSERGEGSTKFLANWAESMNLRFVTIDLEKRESLAWLGDSQWVGRGEDLLPTIDGTIAVAYLDSFDWFYAPEQTQQYQEFYTSYGYEPNNNLSSEVHLLQAQHIHNKSRVGTVVCLDDTWHENEGWAGKGGKAVPWLETHGWDIVERDGVVWTGYVIAERTS